MNDSDFVEARDVPRDESLAKVEIALLSVVFVSAAVLNTSLLLVLWKQRKQMSRMRVFVFHLCLADLVVTFFQVCPQLLWDITDRFVGPDLVCRLVKYLQVLGMFSSTYMIVVMTVDRYQAICNPMVKFQRTRTRLNVPVCVAWGISLLGSLPQVFIFSQVEVTPGVFDCWATFIQPWGLQTYITWTTLVIFVLPVITVVVCQVRICRVIQINIYQKTQQKGTVGLPSRASGVAGMSKARVKTLKMTVVIVLAYIVCWAPFFTVQLWSAWDKQAPKESKYCVYLLCDRHNQCSSFGLLRFLITQNLSIFTHKHKLLISRWQMRLLGRHVTLCPPLLIPAATFTILMLLASLNSCANPCIYLLFSGQVPKRLVSLLCRRHSDGKDSVHEEATLVSTLYLSLKNPPESK